MRANTLKRDWAGVRVRHTRNSKTYRLDPEPDKPVFSVMAGTEIRPLENDETVVGVDGDPIKPAGRFYVTAGTIVPYHAIMDIFGGVT